MGSFVMKESIQGWRIIEFTEDYHTWANELIEKHWTSSAVVSLGNIHRADELPGFIALWEGKPSGLVTYHISVNQCEIVTLNSEVEGKGIGTALIKVVKSTALMKKCTRLWLITTNDNIDAIRFYQKRGFTIAAVHRNAIENSRKLKPSIPFIGNDGIPIRDEIEFEMIL